ncbi:MAG: transglutaminase family protein [Smithellaceae bacterium]|nr:transglutaminase family protein [Smithellaceae bacterium]
MQKILFAVFFILALCAEGFCEKHLLRPPLATPARCEFAEQFNIGKGAASVSLSFVVPPDYQTSSSSQTVSDFALVFSPPSQKREISTDQWGNQIIKSTWQAAPATIDVKMTYNVQSEVRSRDRASSAPFPLTDVDPFAKIYLQATKQVQADDPAIQALSSELTAGTNAEIEAVRKVISHVADRLNYVAKPPQYDALFTLETGTGNCQNYCHLCAALLRAAGIPTRIVRGVTLKDPVNINAAPGVATFKIDRRKHSWIEVWFPDLGWAPYDPQTAGSPVSGRFVKIEIGPDNDATRNDGLVRRDKAVTNSFRTALPVSSTGDGE